ncbi:MAG: class I SAM-dependent methyltransferase [Deltaproteobacteria bacterium]|nr:class I SAM-dependent methyltransferase [Deltaproteobacteria bacterium]MBW2070812.1 class I SAM-dependent methyltransferase [Deltaproteobacteria bacterium]
MLACPQCKAVLSETTDGFCCDFCRQQYPVNQRGQLDLRLREPQRRCISVTIGDSKDLSADIQLQRLVRHPRPAVDFSGLPVPPHLDVEILSHFPRATTTKSIALDLGCGSEVHREVLEHCGFAYCGIDYRSPGSTILADAHAIPLADSSVELVLCLAVLEHVRYPLVVSAEISRVMRTGGKLIGTVAFLEPYHDLSFYHPTHLGVADLLSQAGLTVTHLAPSKGWSIFTAAASMALFPKFPKKLSKALMFPTHFLHRLCWKHQYRRTAAYRWSETYRVLSTTAAFTFIASK